MVGRLSARRFPSSLKGSRPMKAKTKPMKAKNAKPQTVVKESDSPPKDTASSWPKPRWEEWLQSPRIRLWQAVALSCDLRPAKILLARKNPLKHKIAPERCREYRRRLRVALRNLGDGLQPVGVGAPKSRCWIKLAEFGAWAVGMGWTLPDELLRVKPGKSPAWPWGTYTTKLLGHLEAAVRAKWSNFNPANPDTAPLNEDVENFLKDRGVLPGTAVYIAKIIHSDDAPKGRPTTERIMLRNRKP